MAQCMDRRCVDIICHKRSDPIFELDDVSVRSWL